MDVLKPTLYELADDGKSLRLLVAVCQDCGATSFPANVYGCRRCGAAPERLSMQRHDGRGVLRGFVTLYQALVPGLEPPVVIGEIELADGVVEEAVIRCGDENELRLGMTMRAVPEEENHDGKPMIGCRFVADEVAA